MPIKVLGLSHLVLGSFSVGEETEEADRLLQMAEQGQIQLWITDRCLRRIINHVGQFVSAECLQRMTSWLTQICQVIDTETIFPSSLRRDDEAEWAEILLEIACALAFNLEAIVTRNPSDLAGTILPVLSVAQLEISQKLIGKWWYRLQPSARSETWHLGFCTISLSANSLSIRGRREKTIIGEQIIQQDLRWWCSTITEITEIDERHFRAFYVLHSEREFISGYLVVQLPPGDFETMQGDVMLGTTTPYGTIIFERSTE